MAVAFWTRRTVPSIDLLELFVDTAVMPFSVLAIWM
jgi:hypothetical protein